MDKPLEKSTLNKIIRHSTFLVIWSVLSAYLMGIFNAAIHWAVLVIYLIVVIASLTEILPSINGLIPVVGSVLIIIITYFKWGLSQSFYLNSGLAILAIWVARYLSARCIKAFHTLKAALQQNRQMMDQFIVYDPETGLMRQSFAEKALSIAIARSQRLNLPLSLMIIDAPQQKDFPNEEEYSTRRLFADLFPKNLREDLDIPFINGKYGVILPEMDLTLAQITAQEMVEEIAHVLDLDITIGIASMTEERTSAEALISAARSALEIGLEIDQPVVTHRLLTAQPKEERNLTEIINGVGHQERMKYLQNPSLGEDEWVVWLNGIQDISTIHWIKERFQSSPSIHFLTVWDQFVVLKLVIGGSDTALFATAFPDWEIQDVDIEKHFVLLTPENPETFPLEKN